MRAHAGGAARTRVGVQPELDPGSVTRRGGGARKRMTGGPRPSVTGGGARGDGGKRAALGRENKLGRCARASEAGLARVTSGRGKELRGCRWTSRC
jgi:hypothetical protein